MAGFAYQQEDLTGRIFGRLTVVRLIDGEPSCLSKWLCRCECGKEKPVRASYLVKGSTRSCGCLQTETRHSARVSHGKSYSPEYAIWRSMIQRCTNPRNKRFRDYGARGIAVCIRWRCFENFYEDMGPRPSPSHQLDRFPRQDGDYQPCNVRWATPKQQQRNRRGNMVLTYQGLTLTAAEWSERTGLSPDTIYQRKRVLRWSDAKTLTEPKKRLQKRQIEPR